MDGTMNCGADNIKALFWGAHRLAARHAILPPVSGTVAALPAALSLRTRCLWSCGDRTSVLRMPTRVLRVRAPLPRGKAKANAVFLCFSQGPLHPVNARAGWACCSEHRKTKQLITARAILDVQRATWNAPGNLRRTACLRHSAITEASIFPHAFCGKSER